MNTKTINCLRCRHCQLEHDTDFKSSLPMIYCAKMQERRVACLTSCPLANPDKKYCGSGQTATRLNGDCRQKSTTVEKAFLATHYQTAPITHLCRATGRDPQTLSGMARRFGFGLRGHSPDRAAHTGNLVQARASKGQVLNASQAAYVIACYNSGFWPAKGGSRSPQFLARQQVIKDAVVAGVEARGVRFEWKSLVKAMRWRSPGYRRWDRARRQRRKAAESC